MGNPGMSGSFTGYTGGMRHNNNLQSQHNASGDGGLTGGPYLTRKMSQPYFMRSETKPAGSQL
jgi:hypothetical protein